MENIIFNDVSVRCDGAVATVTNERESKLNALNSDVLDQLYDAFDAIGKESDVHAVVLTGAGTKAFAAGADLAEITTKESIVDLRTYYAKFNKLYTMMGSIPQPIVAKVNGYAFGGGCLLAIAADMVVATKKSSFSQPEVNFGFTGGAALLPRLIGRHKAAEITMLGRPFTADEAYALGLVNHLVEEEELEADVAGICKTLLKKDALALAMIKQCIRNSLEVGLTAANKFEDECSTVCLHREESKQLIVNFLNRSK